MVASTDGRIAILYWSRCAYRYIPLILVDWSCDQLLPSCWAQANDLQHQLAARCRARFGPSGAWVEGVELAHQAATHGIPARQVPEWIAHKDYWPRLQVAAADFIASSAVRVTDEALAKTRVKPFPALGSYRHQERTDDPLLPAFLYGVVMALDETAAHDPKLGVARDLVRQMDARFVRQ
jgi:hypothetical protein